MVVAAIRVRRARFSNRFNATIELSTLGGVSVTLAGSGLLADAVSEMSGFGLINDVSLGAFVTSGGGSGG